MSRESKDRQHTMLTELESRSEMAYVVEEQEILFDLKHLLRDYYAATFTIDGTALKVTFNNGQTFLLKAEEQKVA